MRIVAGTFGGRIIEAPESDATRPTYDRVREALFSSLFSLRGGMEGAVVLDAFAGSGALGFESLSRGAESVYFCDTAKDARDCILRNAKNLGLTPSSYTLSSQDVLKHLPSGLSPFDLIFLDPPYAFEVQEIFDFLENLAGKGKVAYGALVVYEHDLRNNDAVMKLVENSSFEMIKRKKYGKTIVDILKFK
ncbi:MAG: 16S rRNA (guanine(966)-N(2))-methyltransferase RsmD [Eggerthellaceae bacterium]|jgi:16S rRNA (guanine966-N2)-methyltransferase